MTPVAPGFNLASLLTTTIADMGRTIADNVTNSLLLFKWLDSKGRKKTRSGGAYISEPVMLDKSTAGGSYRGYEESPAIPQDGVTQAIYPYRQYRWFVTMSGLEGFQNSGVGKVIELLQQKHDQMIISFQDKLNTDAYGDGSGNSYKNILGLQAICPDDPDGAAVDNLGLIDAGANPVWQSYSASSVGAWSTGTNVGKDLRLAWIGLSKGRDHPTIIIMPSDLYNEYEQQLVTLERYKNVDVASEGFLGLMFKSAPCFYDEDIDPSDDVYLLNHKHMRWNVASGVDFTPSSFHETAERDALVSVTKVYGNLSCSNRRFQGKVHTIT